MLPLGFVDEAVHPYSKMSSDAVRILQFVEDHDGAFTYEELQAKFSAESDYLTLCLHRSLGGLRRERFVIDDDGKVFLSQKHKEMWQAWLTSNPKRTRVPKWARALAR